MATPTTSPCRVVASGPYVVLGGEFTAVNGVKQQGLVRMAAPGYAPRKQGPLGVTAGSRPTVSARAAKAVAVSWRTAWDRDDQALIYTLLRGDQVVARRTLTSRFWSPTTVSVVDGGVSPGRTYEWRVVVSDADGNQVTSASTWWKTPS